MIPVAEIISSALKKGPLAKKIKGQLLLDAWPEIVGEHIARKTEAVSFENGTLLVRVTDSVWTQHLLLQKKQMLTKINAVQHTRMVKDIRFITGKVPGLMPPVKETANQKPWRGVLLSGEELSPIEEALTEAKLPPELAESMRAVFIAAKQKQKMDIALGHPVCLCCGLPLIKTAAEIYCLRCKTEELGKITDKS